MSQSRSNVIDLHKWLETQSRHTTVPRHNCFASQHECIQHLEAFIQIANPAYRFALTRAAREAASKTANERPKDSA